MHTLVRDALVLHTQFLPRLTLKESHIKPKIKTKLYEIHPPMCYHTQIQFSTHQEQLYPVYIPMRIILLRCDGIGQYSCMNK